MSRPRKHNHERIIEMSKNDTRPKDIAKQLGVPYETVRTIIKRAKRKEQSR